MAANIDMSSADDSAASEEQTLRSIEWERIADRLLNSNLWLTALELYTELIENGIESPRLRDFFSNPGNFERQNLPKEPMNICKNHIAIISWSLLEIFSLSEIAESQYLRIISLRYCFPYGLCCFTYLLH